MSENISRQEEVPEQGYDLAGQRKPKGINWKSTVIFAAVFFLIVAGTFTFLFSSADLDFGSIPSLIKEMSVGYLFAGLGLLLLYVYSEGRAIASLGGAIGIKIGHVKSTLYACVDQFFAGITPSASGGQPAAIYFMAKEGIKVAKSSAIMLTNTMHYTVSLLILSTFTLIKDRELIISQSASVPTFKVLLILGYIANCCGFLSCLLFIFAPRLIRIIAAPIYRLLGRIKLMRDPQANLVKLDAALEDYAECHRLIRAHPFAQVKALFWNVVQKVSSCAIAYCVYRSLGYNELGAVDIICIHIIIVLTVNAIPLPGSAGASELITHGLYKSIYAGEALAASAMLFYRSISFYLMIIACGAVSVVYYVDTVRKRIKKRDENR